MFDRANNEFLTIKVIRNMIENKDNQIVSILKGDDIDKRRNVISLINTMFSSIEDRYNFLESIDKSHEFNSRDWFFFGVVFSSQRG